MMGIGFGSLRQMNETLKENREMLRHKKREPFERNLKKITITRGTFSSPPMTQEVSMALEKLVANYQLTERRRQRLVILLTALTFITISTILFYVLGW